MAHETRVLVEHRAESAGDGCIASERATAGVERGELRLGEAGERSAGRLRDRFRCAGSRGRRDSPSRLTECDERNDDSECDDQKASHGISSGTLMQRGHTPNAVPEMSLRGAPKRRVVLTQERSRIDAPRSDDLIRKAEAIRDASPLFAADQRPKFLRFENRAQLFAMRVSVSDHDSFGHFFHRRRC